ncbi:hypothetical protein ABDK00_001680 [Niabella insulamsoli]|uniref:hypothetical protein n=1 Tax=Niabella insulamsoli TaxID=3144874 RepID=UPI0031FCF5E7
MTQVIQNSDQCIADVAIQAVGSIDAAVGICLDNDLSITDEQLQPVEAGPVASAKIVEVLNINKPASSAGEIADGLGVWRVGLDFKVS